MGDCDHIVAEVEAYLDGELTAERSGEVHAHVDGCATCADRAAFERRLREMLRGACGTCEFPPGLVDRIRARLDEPSAG